MKTGEAAVIYSKVISGAVSGIEAEQIVVEADVSFGFPALNIVGLPDTAIRESRERVRTAIVNSGFRFPDKRVTVNLSPANLRKEGSHFDLPIAVSILAASGLINSDDFAKIGLIGELALDGKINHVKGVLPMLAGLKEAGINKVVIPAENTGEGQLMENMDIYAAESLREVVDFFEEGTGLKKLEFYEFSDYETHSDLDFSDVTGQENAKRALQIASAALHNILMVGPPGSGKTMLAKRLPTIMPPLSHDEKMELTKIYSAYGLLNENEPLVGVRPFRAPDHTISPTSLIGGGKKIKAGEVSLAHLGVLFLDEFPEFSRASLESLRKPMEDEECRITRLSGSVVMPSKFLTVAAMNPCPCGFYGDASHQCTCSVGEIKRYRSRLSGPLLDRIDMTVNVNTPDFRTINERQAGTPSSFLKKDVLRARRMQEERFKGEKIKYNSQMKSEHLKKYCALDRDAEKLLNRAFDNSNFSVRSYDRILRVARTIADMSGSEKIKIEHIAEAVSYKCENELFK